MGRTEHVQDSRDAGVELGGVESIRGYMCKGVWSPSHSLRASGDSSINCEFSPRWGFVLGESLGGITGRSYLLSFVPQTLSLLLNTSLVEGKLWPHHPRGRM